MATTPDDPFVALASSPRVVASTQELEPDAAHAQAQGMALSALLGTAAQALVGRFDGFDLLDRALVTGIPDCPGERVVARSTVALRHADVGRDVVLMFEQGDPRRPLVMGLLQDAGPAPAAAEVAATVVADNERQLIHAERELVLRCGDASITLTRAGKVVIEGRYVLSRSSGYNKIKGAAVDIN